MTSRRGPSIVPRIHAARNSRHVVRAGNLLSGRVHIAPAPQGFRRDEQLVAQPLPVRTIAALSAISPAEPVLLAFTPDCLRQLNREGTFSRPLVRPDLVLRQPDG